MVCRQSIFHVFRSIAYQINLRSHQLTTTLSLLPLKSETFYLIYIKIRRIQQPTKMQFRSLPYWHRKSTHSIRSSVVMLPHAGLARVLSLQFTLSRASMASKINLPLYSDIYFGLHLPQHDKHLFEFRSDLLTCSNII